MHELYTCLSTAPHIKFNDTDAQRSTLNLKKSDIYGSTENSEKHDALPTRNTACGLSWSFTSDDVKTLDSTSSRASVVGGAYPLPPAYKDPAGSQEDEQLPSLDESLRLRLHCRLVAYDTLLTLSREVESIWKRRLSAITVLFVCQRWVLILDGVLQNLPTTRFWEYAYGFWFMRPSPLIMTSFQVQDPNNYRRFPRYSRTSGHGWYAKSFRFTLRLMVTGAAFSTLRIWAIWGHAFIPTLAVALTSAVVPAINLFAYTQVTSFSVDEGNCSNDVRYSLAVSVRRAYLLLTNWTSNRAERMASLVEYAARGATIASDALVLLLTWMKTAVMWRESKKIGGPKVSVSTLLLRDGTLYFGMMLVLNIVALILTVFQTDADASEFIAVLNAVGANLLARFLLDLRSVHEEGSAGGTAHTVSSVNFAAGSLGANMGAPLGIEDSTWVSGPADDVANERDQRYEEATVPFRAGLGLDDSEVPLESMASTGHEALNNDLESSTNTESSTVTRDILRNRSTAAVV
ncbi:hypothetical protein EIP91_004123 [Steccherinum ochraceum]|uniref:DUF6533 domain-containing protein n=1 Tax=Steccherinum ochraceum TaxID=92696 RepID=A0A4V2MW11_9APHY|nr:hypothetical protein EIP91_004123 [Steccherinum ochraceum]